MANEYITSEVNKIIADKDLPFPKNMAYAASWIIANFKGVNLKIFEVGHHSSLADYFVIASTSNAIQSRAITDEILFNLKENGLKNLSTEGLTDADWILIDFGDIIIHLFIENNREIYDLDSLWKKMNQLKIPNDYYHSKTEHDKATSPKQSPDGYF